MIKINTKKNPLQAVDDLKMKNESTKNEE